MEAPASIDLTIGPPESAGARLLSARLPGSALSARLPGLDEPALHDLAARWRRRALGAPEVDALGAALFAALIEPIRPAYEAAAAGLAPGGAMRLALRFDRGDPAAALPWELLRHPLHGPLAFSGVSLLRTLTHATPRAGGPITPTLPLRVLLTSAGDGLGGELAAELGAVAAALAPFGPDMDLQVERRLTPERLAELLAEPFHIWHFVGHGGMGPSGSPCLYLEDQSGDRFAIYAATLAARVRASSLRLVVLDACNSAAIPPEQQAGGLEAIAPALVAAGAPAVIGMQAAADIEAARRFAAGLYAALARGLPPDRSVAEARLEVAERLGSGIADWAVPAVYVGDPQADLGLPWPRPACPYPGMAPFGAGDSRRFFGRDDEIRALRARLDRERRVLVIGPSGSGKSSLVRAGLLPGLVNEGWLVREMRPGADPVATLVVTQDQSANTRGQRLLLIDQLEELFTLAPREAQAPFAAALAELSSQGWRLLLTMRADFFGDLMSSRLWPFSASERLEIARLRGDQLRQAIARPAAQAAVHLAPELIERLLADAADEPGALPLVQAALVLLWARLDARRSIPAHAYRSLASAIATNAEQVMAGLGESGQAVARRILVRLVHFGEGRAHTRRQQPLAALRSEGDDPALFDATLRTLTDGRLLTVSSDRAGAALADLSHEALIGGWPALLRWIEERREAEERRRLDAKVAEWIARGSGAGALLDELELADAERWLSDPQVAELGVHPQLPALIERSRATIVERFQVLERLRYAAVARGLAASALRQFEAFHQHERAALLAYHAHQFDERSGGAAREQVDDALRQILAAERFSITLPGHAAAFSPDGRWLAVSELDGTLRLWNMAGQGRPQEVLAGATARARAVVFSPNGTLVALADWSGAVHLWDLVQHTHCALQAVYAGRSHGLAFSPDGATLAIAGQELLLWDVSQPEKPPRAHVSDQQGALSVAWTADGRLHAGFNNGVVTLDILHDRALSFQGGQGRLLSLAVSPDQQVLMTGSHGRLEFVEFYPDDDPSVLEINGEARSLVLSPDGMRLYVGTNTGEVLIWLRRSAASSWYQGNTELSATYSSDQRGDIHVALSPGGSFLATSSAESGTVRLWRLGRAPAVPERIPARLRRDKDGTFFSLAVAPDGSTLAIRGAGIPLAIFRRGAAGWRQEKREADEGEEYRSPPTTIALSNTRLARATWEGAILVTDLSAPLDAAVALPNPYAAEVLALVFDPPGQRLAALVRPHSEEEIAASLEGSGASEANHMSRIRLAASSNCTVLLWDLALPEQAPVLIHAPAAAAEPEEWLRSEALAFSPDGSILAAAGADGTICAWRLDMPGVEPIGLVGNTLPIGSLSFGAGTQLAAVDRSGSVQLWDLREPPGSRTLSGDYATAAAYDPSGAWLAAGYPDGVIRVWQADQLERAPIGIKAHAWRIAQLTWAGGRLFSSSTDGTVRVWEAGTSRLAGMVCGQVWRNLSEREWRDFVGPELPYEAACPLLPVPPDS